jgi:hypothetical protein
MLARVGADAAALEAAAAEAGLGSYAHRLLLGTFLAEGGEVPRSVGEGHNNPRGRAP